MLRTRTDARQSSTSQSYTAPLLSTAARGRAQADAVLRDLAYVLHLTRTVRESLVAPVAS
jgi:hypothetical protein